MKTSQNDDQGDMLENKEKSAEVIVVTKLTVTKD